MKFRSDNEATGRGFLLSYSYGTFHKHFGYHRRERLNLLIKYYFLARMVEHSGRTGVITSILYPDYVYVFEGKYAYRITVDVGFSVQISFDNCILKRDSKIVIYDGFDESNSPELITQQQDDISKEPVISQSNVVYITFSIQSFSESKFKIIWNQVCF